MWNRDRYRQRKEERKKEVVVVSFVLVNNQDRCRVRLLQATQLISWPVGRERRHSRNGMGRVRLDGGTGV